jgi:mono/diheme cytochrome c family protein
VGILVGALVGSTCALAATPLYPTAPMAGDKGQYRDLYRLRCASCHGANGEGTFNDMPKTGPALKGNPFVQHAPSAAIIQVIRKGRTGEQRLYHETFPNMPAFGAEAVFDVDGLVQFLKTDLQK